MNANSLRSEVLACYKALHRTRLKVFSGDTQALQAGRRILQEEFIKNANEQSKPKIKRLLRIGWDCELIIRKTVVQGQLNERGNFEFNIRQEMFDEEEKPRKGPLNE